MIVDELTNFKNYINLNENFSKVLDFITKNDLKNMSAGSYEIEGKTLFVNIDEYKTKAITESVPEAHRNYIDIQIVLNGHEKIGYSNLKNGKTEIEYNSERDIEFLRADCEYLKAHEGRFYIFFPQDLHHPCITDENQSDIKKAVFKIKL